MPTNFRRQILTATIIIGGSVMAFGAGFYFLSKSVGIQAEKIVTAQTFIAKDSAALAAFAELKKNAAEAALYQNAMEKVLVPKEQLLDFPRWLDGIARTRQVGLVFSFVGGESLPQAETPGFIGFSADITGTFDNLTAFIKDIEFNSARFLANFDGFDLTRSESNYRLVSQGKVFFK